MEFFKEIARRALSIHWNYVVEFGSVCQLVKNGQSLEDIPATDLGASPIEFRLQ